MKNILIVRGKKAYLPEADAYKSFFKKNYNIKIVEKLEKEDLRWADIIWKFMGIDINFFKYKKEQYIIHDYRSLSKDVYKDKIREKINLKPNLRIFLNEEVKKGFKFEDNILNIKLDMGIDKKFISKNKNEKKEFKFVYCGAINKFREIDKVLEWFLKNSSKEDKFLLIGEPSEEIKKEFLKYSQLKFIGKIDYEFIPEYLQKAEYAFCNIPNIFPYNIQTPTKLLEYIAMNLKIISNKTPWINKFLKENKEEKIYLYEALEDINIQKLEQYSFQNINMEKYLWDNIIQKSGLINILKYNG